MVSFANDTDFQFYFEEHKKRNKFWKKIFPTINYFICVTQISIFMKKMLAIASLVVGIIGLGVFFQPVLEIICGIGGLILAICAKDKNAGTIIKAIRSVGFSVAWLNIIWVCLELGLKYAGIELF